MTHAGASPVASSGERSHHPMPLRTVDPTPLQRALADLGAAHALAPGEALDPAALGEAPMVLITAGAVLVEHTRGAARSALVLAAGEALAGPCCVTTRALLPTRAYALRSLSVIAKRHPDVAARITVALLRQQDRHADVLTLSHLPRAEDRVLGLLELLAERFGRRGADGVRIDLPLRHADIGRLVGGRRPTITTAVTALEQDGRLRREAGTGLFVLLADVDGRAESDAPLPVTPGHARGAPVVPSLTRAPMAGQPAA